MLAPVHVPLHACCMPIFPAIHKTHHCQPVAPLRSLSNLDLWVYRASQQWQDQSAQDWCTEEWYGWNDEEVSQVCPARTQDLPCVGSCSDCRSVNVAKGSVHQLPVVGCRQNYSGLSSRRECGHKQSKLQSRGSCRKRSMFFSPHMLRCCPTATAFLLQVAHCCIAYCSQQHIAVTYCILQQPVSCAIRSCQM